MELCWYGAGGGICEGCGRYKGSYRHCRRKKKGKGVGGEVGVLVLWVGRAVLGNGCWKGTCRGIGCQAQCDSV